MAALRHSLISLATAAILGATSAGGLPAQVPWTWGKDPEAALRRATEKDRLVLMLFTVGEGCARCRAVEKRVFDDPVAQRRLSRVFEPVRLMYAGGGATGKMTPADQAPELWASRAGLRGYPTIYVVDAEGWPCLMQAGFRDEAKAARALLGALDGVRKTRARIVKLRKAGRPGLEKLMAWYEKRGMRLGQWRAASELFVEAKGARRAALVPLLVAPTIVEKGFAAAAPLFAIVEKHDPQSRRGWHAPALYDAANLLLRRCDLESACTLFHRLLRLEKVSVRMRLEAEMGLGMAYRKRDDKPKAREHYERCRKLAASLGTRRGRMVAAQAALRIEQLDEEGHDHERCPDAPRR